MLRQRCGQLLARLEHGLQLLELGGSVEEDYIRIARCFEATRQRCCRLEQDGRRAREQLARVEAERATLEVKLKHARNQVEVEMKKRHRAEAELEKQERKLQLVLELLMREPGSNEALSREQCSVLSALTGRRLGAALAPVRRSSAVDESCQSLLSHSDISYDRTEDDVDVDMTVVRTLKRKVTERQRVSLAPQVGPVVMAKRHRSSVVAHNAVSVPSMPPPAEVPGSADSLLPAVLVPQRRSRQGHRVSTRAGLPPLPPASAELTTVWGTNEDLGCHAAGQESHTEGSSVGQPEPAPFPSPPQSLPPVQHKFTSKTVIRPEPCGVCGSRIRFGKTAIKCCQCQLLLHTKCREQCPSLCVPRPHHHAWPREGVLADFAPSTPPLVPTLVVQCVTEVETRGLTEDFLRGLKEPLVTFSLHPAFLRAADIPDDAASDTALRHVVSKLPPANRDTLAFLMLHLFRVSQSPDCKMDVLNLSRVFGPTLVGHSSANPTPLAIMEDTPRQCKVVARLLSLPPSFWRGFVGTEQENLVPIPAPRRECAVPTLSCRTVLPAHCLPRAQARPAEPSWHLLPPQHPAELRGHGHPAPAGAGPEEGGPVLPFSCVACSSGSFETRSQHWREERGLRDQAAACGVTVPSSKLCSASLGPGEQSWLCPAVVAGTLP
ncbi:rac GTPase-activating protein 1-like isoform 2-T2 [Cyanocitta cristata]